MTQSATRTDTRKMEPSLTRALWGGIAFSLVFTGLIWWAGGRLDAIELLPDQGASWYYWKLPHPTLWSRLTAWGFYALHQLTIWGLIAYAQRRDTKSLGHGALGPQDTKGVHSVNLIALAANAFFITLHFIQTHIWYDGLAQDVSIWTSQGSVVLMLVLILLMENRRRGLFWGKKAPFLKRAGRVARKYHGYVFAWAVVYTFWYHPMVSTSGHLTGFFYMFLLMLQGSLFFTRLHINRWWKVVQEATVTVHGALVAVMQGNGLWPMFFFGFGGIFVLTQMHGLKLRPAARWAILGLYIAGVGVTYSQRGWVQLNEIVRIPIIEYALVFVLAGLISLGLYVVNRLGPAQASEGSTA